MKILIEFFQENKHYILAFLNLMQGFFMLYVFLVVFPAEAGKPYFPLVLFLCHIIFIASLLLFLFTAYLAVKWFVQGREIISLLWLLSFLFVFTFSIKFGLRYNHYEGLINMQDQRSVQK